MLGCATGYLMEAAAARGWTPYGVEYAEWSAAIAQKKFGSEAVFNGTLEQCTFPENYFDAIVMCDLIEHVRRHRKRCAKQERC